VVSKWRIPRKGAAILEKHATEPPTTDWLL